MSPRALVIDASVAIKWIVEEDDSGLAEALRGQDLLAPDLLRLECLSAIWRRILRGQLVLAEVPEALILLEELPIRFSALDGQLDEILRLSVWLNHPVYDCAYLALALASDCAVVTADRRFVAAVRKHQDFAQYIILLHELAH